MPCHFQRCKSSKLSSSSATWAMKKITKRNSYVPGSNVDGYDHQILNDRRTNFSEKGTLSSSIIFWRILLMEQILLYLWRLKLNKLGYSLYQLLSQISSIYSIIESVFFCVSAKFLEVIMQKNECHFQEILRSGNFKWGTETRPYGTMEQGKSFSYSLLIDWVDWSGFRRGSFRTLRS